MSKKDNLSDFLLDIAEAIRSKKGVTTPINPQKFSEEILSISGGDISGIINGTITEVTGSTLSGVETIRDNAFSGLTIENVNIPSNVSSIGANAFSNNNISTLTIDEGVTTIGASAFENNQITTLKIPQTVTTIGASAFAGNNLTEITMESDTPPVVTDTTFPSSLQTTNVSYNGYQNYVDDENWQTYKDTLVRGLAIPSTITVTVNNYLGELVNGANVTIEGNGLVFTGTTNASGIFVQGDLQPATYTISVSDLEGFKTPSVQEVIVEENTQNSIVVTYLEKPVIVISRVFSENSPEVISLVSQEISDATMTSAEVEATYGWKLGDTKDITLSTGETIQMQIIGFNHDNKSDGSGKAGITLQMVNCLAIMYAMNGSRTSNGGYGSSLMRNTTLPTIKKLLPQEWQDAIKIVHKKSANGGSSAYTETLTLPEDLFLLSEIELFGTVTNAKAGETEGEIYEYWNGKVHADRIKRLDQNMDGIFELAYNWWLRSVRSSDNTGFVQVSSDGGSSSYKADYSRGVSFAFCV